MPTKRTKASEFRRRLLEVYRDCWEQAPADNQYVTTQSVWDRLTHLKPFAQLDDRFVSAVFQSLSEDGLVENIAVGPQEKQTLVSRITDKGFEYLNQSEEVTRTRRIALLGAVTGIMSLLLMLVNLLFKLMK